MRLEADRGDASLEALKAWAEAAEPVFICGQSRSGTSMLLLALGRHPAMFHVRDVFETFIFHRPRSVLEEPVPRMVQSYLRGEDTVLALRQAAADLAPASGPLSDDDLLRLFFKVATEQAYDGRRPLEKTPGHVFALDLIFRLFPRARVLVCVREPVDVLASMRARLAREQANGKPAEALRWLAIEVPDLIKHLRQVDKAISAAALAHPTQLFQVPYGWITGQPEAALRQICEFLKLPFDEAVLAPQTRRARERVDPLLDERIGSAGTATAASRPPEGSELLRRQTWGVAGRWRRVGLLPVEPAADAAAPSPPAASAPGAPNSNSPPSH